MIKEYTNLGKYGVINALPASEIPDEAFRQLQNIIWKDGRLRKLPGLVEKNATVIGTNAVRGVYKAHQVVPNVDVLLASSGGKISKFADGAFSDLYSGLIPDTQIEFLEVPPYVYFYSDDNQIRRFDYGATTYTVGESSGLGNTAPRKYSRIIYNAYAGRYFGIGRKDNPDYLEWSEHTDNEGIEKWPTGNIQIVKSTNGDVPLEIDEFEGRITMFSRNSINSGSVVGVPENWSFDREKAQAGTIARRTVKRFGSSFLMLTPDFEVYLWPQDIFVTYRALEGGKRSKRIKFNIDQNRAHLACAEIVENRYYYLSFESGSNEPDDDYHLWIYDILGDVWSGPHKGYNIASMFWDKDTNLLICGGAGSTGQAGNLSGYVLEHRGLDIRNKISQVHAIGSYHDYGSPIAEKRYNKIHITSSHQGSLPGGVGQLEVITNVDGAYNKIHTQRIALEDPATDNDADSSAVKDAVTKRGFIHDDKGLGNRIQVEFKHAVQTADLQISQFAIEYDVKKYAKEDRNS